MNRRKWIALIGCALLGVAVVAGSMGQAQAGKTGLFGGANRADPAEQLTRAQMDLFEVTCSHAQLAKFELDAISDGSPSTADALQRLGQIGAARLLIHYDNVVNLTDKTTISSGRSVPTIKDITISNGSFTPSISYDLQGLTVALTGAWLAPEDPTTAQISLSLNCKNPEYTKDQFTTGFNAPVFEERLASQYTRVLKSGEPVWLACNDLQLGTGPNVQTHLTVIRLKASQLMEAR
jgi:hypothetical protein